MCDAKISLDDLYISRSTVVHVLSVRDGEGSKWPPVSNFSFSVICTSQMEAIFIK